MTAHTAAQVASRTRGMMLATAGLAVAMCVLAAAVIFASWPDDAWDPLGPYEAQHVNLPANGVDGIPTLSLSSDPLVVPATGEKCVTGQGFTIVGQVSWQSVEPPGTIIRTGEGTRDAVNGCTRFEYVNVVPRSVRLAMLAQLNAGIVRPRWRIIGLERPIRDGRTDGASQAWATERFAVAP